MLTMDFCQYEEVNTDGDESTMKDRESVKSVLKQVLICSTVCAQFFTAGLCLGSPTVFIPQMKREGVEIDDEMASWLYTTTVLPVIPWVIIIPVLAKRIGRKVPQIITSVTTLISLTLLYFSKNVYQMLMSEIFQGFLHAGNFTITILAVMEYSSPRYRGLFLAIKSASFFWGIWIANVIGTFFHWKNILVVGMISTVYMFNAVFWPESPFWLASKGRFDECRKSFRWVHGLNKESEAHLRELIASQRESINSEKQGYKISFIEMFKTTEFYKPLILSVTCIIQYHFSGRIVCSLYILDIFKKITEDEKSAYTAMLVLDGLTVFGMYVGSFLSKILYRRTLYMSSSFAGVLFLFIISLYLLLVRLRIVEESIYITIVLLTLYSIAMSCGPLILAMSVYGELVPIKYQESCYIIISMTFVICYSTLIKLAPQIFGTFGVDGTFFFYGVICGLCTVYLYLYLPETKNKTQHEIEMFFKDKKRNGDLKEVFRRERIIP